MAAKAHLVLTTGYTDATHVNTAASAILAHADVATVQVHINIPELNLVGWYIASETTFTGDDNDWLVVMAHELLVQGYIMTSIVLYSLI
jgi:hypothetical protein